jgi:threonine dehydratase
MRWRRPSPVDGITSLSWLDDLPAAIAQARSALAPHILHTPTTRALWREDFELHLKCEHLQHTGSFKLRGAVNRMQHLTDAERAAGVVAASTGNHGQGVARAGRALSVPVTVYVPESAAPVKIAPMRAMGAEVVTVSGDGLAAELAARAAAASCGQVFVSPYNDPLVIAGQGTIGMELDEALTELDAVFVSVGGGGLISGIGAWLKHRRPGVRVYGCWPENAPTMARCLERGLIHEVRETETLSDGTAGGVEPDAITLESCQACIDGHVFVSEAEIGAALATLARKERWIVEGSAGVALAGCLQHAESLSGQKAAVVLCGRNIDFGRFLGAIGEGRG